MGTDEKTGSEAAHDGIEIFTPAEQAAAFNVVEQKRGAEWRSNDLERYALRRHPQRRWPSRPGAALRDPEAAVYRRIRIPRQKDRGHDFK